MRLPAEYYSSSSTATAVLTTGVELVCAVCGIYTRRCAVCGTTAVQIRSDLGNGRPHLSFSHLTGLSDSDPTATDIYQDIHTLSTLCALYPEPYRAFHALKPRRPQNQKPPRQQFSAFCILDSTHHRDNTAARSRRTGGAEAKLSASTPEARYHPSER